jgi:hypothetical protein
MAQRRVEPEILDHLAANDPEALRSRMDLRRINFLMGNERWICREIHNHPDASARGIVELGAGDGALACKLARMFPDSDLTACDLAPRPAGLAGRILWRQGDLLDPGTSLAGGVLVANLFLHHFEGGQLDRLGRICEGFEVVIFNEPDRRTLPHLLGALMWPMVNRVTRHDMHVSIRAGFAQGELAALLGLDGKSWRIRETFTWRGARHMIGCRT